MDVEIEVMKRLILLACTVTTIGLLKFVKSEENCKGLRYRDNYYEPELVKEGITNLRGLTVSNRRNNAIFFTYSNFDENVKSRSAYINLEDGTFNIVHGLNNTNVNAADDMNDIVYIGAIDGLYKLDSDGRLEKTEINDNVISVSIAGSDIYYVNSKNEVYVIKNDMNSKLKVFDGTKVLRVAVNPYGDIVFITNDHRVGSLKNGADEYRFHNNDARTLAVDRSGVIYVSTKDGLYEYVVSDDDFVKVADLANLQGIVFINDNTPVYAISGMIMKLNRILMPCSEKVMSD